MSGAPFVTDPARTGIVIAYRNQAYIADEVLPRVPVGDKDFSYQQMPLGEAFTIPDTAVGRRGAPNEVEFSMTESTATAYDYGLDDTVPQDDIDRAARMRALGSVYDPLDHASEFTAELIALDRERRTANLVFNAASYPAGNKVQLAGNQQFSDFTNSDPLGVLLAAMDACLVRPNIAVIGRPVFTKLRQHPKIVKGVLGNDGDSGAVSRRQLADLLELEDVLIGESRANTAKKGQAVNLARLWGKHIALIHRNRQANTQRGLTFGYTAQYGTRIAGTRPDPDIGLRGGQRVRVGETVKELIVAGQAGYFVEDAVA